MASAFVTSSRYELAFWEAAYRQERWPDQATDARPAPATDSSPG